jgi:hypothetical protein
MDELPSRFEEVLRRGRHGEWLGRVEEVKGQSLRPFIIKTCASIIKKVSYSVCGQNADTLRVRAAANACECFTAMRARLS